jgi:hypothetical protein
MDIGGWIGGEIPDGVERYPLVMMKIVAVIIP